MVSTDTELSRNGNDVDREDVELLSLPEGLRVKITDENVSEGRTDMPIK